MTFEFVRGSVRLASVLSDVARARARGAAQSLLSVPAAGIVRGGKVAVRAGFLAEELLTTAAANRSNISTLIRSEVDVAITRMGLVSVQQLEEAQAEAARLRTEVARLRSTSSTSPTTAAPPRNAKKAVAPSRAAKDGAASRATTKRAAAKPRTAADGARTSRSARTESRQAVTTRSRPVGP